MEIIISFRIHGLVFVCELDDLHVVGTDSLLPVVSQGGTISFLMAHSMTSGAVVRAEGTILDKVESAALPTWSARNVGGS